MRDELIKAFESNEYVALAKIGRILFSSFSQEINIEVNSTTNSNPLSRSASNVTESISNRTLAAAEFTANLDVVVESSSIDIEASITDSFKAFATNAILDMARVKKIPQNLTDEIDKHLSKFKKFILYALNFRLHGSNKSRSKQN